MKIVTVTPSNKPKLWPYLLDNISRQVRKPDIAILLINLEEQHPTLDWQYGISRAGVQPVVVRNPDNNTSLGHLFNLGFSRAADMLDKGLICVMSDDDCYEELYFDELEKFFLEFPNAAMIGKKYWRCRWMDNSRPPLFFPGGPAKHGERVLGDDVIAGSTISISAEAWRKQVMLRFSENDKLGDVGIRSNARNLGVPVYTTSSENFWLQRWGKDQGHLWVWHEDPWYWERNSVVRFTSPEKQ